MAVHHDSEHGSRPEERVKDKKRFSMLRTFVLADLITLGNAACGTGAIFLCLRYVADGQRVYIWTALALLPLALICDVADGSVARWRRKHSPLGADLDSLADVVSFGVAPAVFGFALGLRGTWDALLLIYFVACGISRLARYNVTHDSMSDESGKVSHYEGTPIPSSLLLVLVLGIAFGMGAVGDRLLFGAVHLLGWDFHPLSLIYALSGSAMISATLKIPKP
ncbi:MAG: CDP-alcohol phosphatidyltransferase family protein [Polyangiales bacterium]